MCGMHHLCLLCSGLVISIKVITMVMTIMMEMVMVSAVGGREVSQRSREVCAAGSDRGVRRPEAVGAADPQQRHGGATASGSRTGQPVRQL